MADDLGGLPAWRPGTQVRFWPGARTGPGVYSLTTGSPFVNDGGLAVVHVAGHDGPVPLERVAWVGHPSTESWWAYREAHR